MNQIKLFPYYYPTTAIFLDDDRDFLFNFSLQLDEHLSYHLFDSPTKTKKHIYEQALRNDRKAIFELVETGAPPSQNHVLQLCLASIPEIIYDRRRFSQISVLVCDYMMPEINGLEFCKTLQDSPIKKVLLTGKANEDTAITAFNSGIINRFIEKNDPDVANKLNSTILELQRNYFRDAAKLLMQTLHVDSLEFLFDETFANYFQELLKEHNIVEYYLSEVPKGFIMLDDEANVHFLMIQSTHDLTIHYEIALDEGAPEGILKQLQTGQKIPYFKDSEGIFNSTLNNPEQYFYDAKEVIGDTHYYCAWLDKPPVEIDKERVLPYSTYLEKLDYILTEKMPER